MRLAQQPPEQVESASAAFQEESSDYSAEHEEVVLDESRSNSSRNTNSNSNIRLKVSLVSLQGLLARSCGCMTSAAGVSTQR